MIRKSKVSEDQSGIDQADFRVDRLDLDHHTWKLMLEGKQYLAPVKDPKSVLDLGTGTGLWAIEVADELADARIIGTDLSPVQASFVPPNVEFLVDNVSRVSFHNPGTRRRGANPARRNHPTDHAPVRK